MHPVQGSTKEKKQQHEYNKERTQINRRREENFEGALRFLSIRDKGKYREAKESLNLIIN